MSGKTPVVQVIGYKNSGKTTLVCQLVRQLKQKGLRVGTVKHSSHTFDIDHPGKDTWRHRKAGAEAVAITSPDRTAIVRQRSTPLSDLLAEMRGVDLVMVEGFKWEPYPKIVIVKNIEHLELLKNTEHVIAVVSWIPLQHIGVPVFHKDDVAAILNTVLHKCHKSRKGIDLVIQCNDTSGEIEFIYKTQGSGRGLPGQPHSADVSKW